VIAVTPVERSSIENGYKVLNQELGLPAKPIAPRAIIPRLASELAVPDAIQRRAETVARQADAAGLTIGVRPSGFAAACLYTVASQAGLCLTQSEIAAVASTTPTTI